jgi:hypothetical protein
MRLPKKVKRLIFLGAIKTGKIKIIKIFQFYDNMPFCTFYQCCGSLNWPPGTGSVI